MEVAQKGQAERDLDNADTSDVDDEKDVLPVLEVFVLSGHADVCCVMATTVLDDPYKTPKDGYREKLSGTPAFH